jgi:hypothetical protein
MLGDDAFILDRHVVAGEGYHPAAAGAVPGVEGQAAKFEIEHVGHKGLLKGSRLLPPVAERREPQRTPVCPFVPESFPPFARGYPFGGQGRSPGTFQTTLDPRGPFA